MEFDNNIKSIEQHISLDLRNVSSHDIMKVTPAGWIEKHVTDPIIILVDALEIKLERLWWYKGLWRFTVSDTTVINYALVFKKLENALSRDFAMTCVVCGKRGIRRKEQEGSPSLCGIHYIQYANYLDTINGKSDSSF